MYKKKDEVTTTFRYIIPVNKSLYDDISKNTSLPNKNEKNLYKSSVNNLTSYGKMDYEYREKINNSKNSYFNYKKEFTKNCERKRRKLNTYYTDTWQEDISKYGYGRCLKAGCNFISSDIRTIRAHYRECDGVPCFSKNCCSMCDCYLPSFESYSNHISICNGFRKYNQRVYKFTNGGSRKGMSKVPVNKLLLWEDQIRKQGSASCGLDNCTFVSKKLSEMKEHYNNGCEVERVRSRYCAHCNFKFPSEEEYSRHKHRCREESGLTINVDDSYSNMTKQKKLKHIVQPEPEFPASVYRRRRPYTKQHIRTWVFTLDKYKYVKCIYQNCNFIALSLEDMICHFGYCNTDSSFAKFVCPYCKGRVTSRPVLMEHIERSHWTNYGIVMKKSNDVQEKNTERPVGQPKVAFDKIEQSKRYRFWQKQVYKFGYAFCTKLKCNFMASNVAEMEFHRQTCDGSAEIDLFFCDKCKNRLPTRHEFEEHELMCNEIEKLRSLAERRKFMRELSPTEKERKEIKTYSRKRKVDVDTANNENSESAESNIESSPEGYDGYESSKEERQGNNEKEIVAEEEVEENENEEIEEGEPERVEIDESKEDEPQTDEMEGINEEGSEKVEGEESEEDESRKDEMEGIKENDLEKAEECEKNEPQRDSMEGIKENNVENAVDEEIEEEELQRDVMEGIKDIDLEKAVDEEIEEEEPQEDVMEGINENDFDKSEVGMESDEDESEKTEESMEIDDSQMQALIQSLENDNSNDFIVEPYSVVGNEVEVFENESSQGTEIITPNVDSRDIIHNEDSGTLDRSEPSDDSDQGESHNDVQETGQSENTQGVEQSGEQNDDTSSEESRDSETNKEGESGGEGEEKKDEDNKESENSKKVEKGNEESENAEEVEENEEKDDDNEDDESEKKKENEETKETKEENEEEEETKEIKEDENVEDEEIKESETITEEIDSKILESSGRSEEKYQDEDSEDKDSRETEKTKENKKVKRRRRRRRSSRKSEGSKESEKDKGEESEQSEKIIKKVREGRRAGRKSKKWSEHEGEEEYIPKGIVREKEGSDGDVYGLAKRRGRRGKDKPIVEDAPKGSKTRTAPQMEEGEDVKCGKCDFKGTRGKFEEHNWTKHIGLGWVDGEKPVDLNDEEEVVRLVKMAFRVTKRGVCEICHDVKRSYMGFVSHVQTCGKTESEMEALKVTCPYCSAKYLKYSLKTHIYVYHSDTMAKDKEKLKGKNRDDDIDAGAEGDLDSDRDQSQDKEKVKEVKGGDTTQESDAQEPVVSSSKRKSALRAVSKFQEAFRDTEEPEKTHEPGYIFYEKDSGKLPKLCSKLSNIWYGMKRKKKKIPCRHQHCKTVSNDVKEAKVHHFTCSRLPKEVYLCEVCDYYSVDESEIQSHLSSSHKKTQRRGRASKEDADIEFAENEDVDEEDYWDDEIEDDDDVEGSENDFEECDSVFERQKKKKNKKKGEEDGKKSVRKRTASDSTEEDVTEIRHKQNFCERERLENIKGDAFYTNALEMAREIEEEEEEDGDDEEDSEEDEDEEKEEEEDSELDNSRSWPQLHTEIEDWCRISRELSSVHLPELMESISVSFTKGDKKDMNWRRFKRFEGDIVEEVPVLFAGGSVRSMSWCKVSFRRMLEKSVKQYLAVSTAKTVDHLTDVNERRKPFTWNLVQIWDCGVLENASPVDKPKFSLGIFQEGGEIWDMLWFPEDNYGKGTNGKLTRIGILATASDDGAIRIWSICDPSQIVFNSRLPLFITEPLVKLIIDTFLEDSCVRLSIGRDGIVAGGYVNGCLAVWNLKNITSPFCEKIGKCVVMRPHLIIQAHRTSITALTFCPNNNRYISSGGLDRVIKLWDLESPWVPVEQYHRELCLDNIWPKNWPLNIYNFDDIVPNNRKGVIRFVKDLISSRHPPCLILENTCLSLSFSDWLNSVCGCSNTGEVKVRFLRNFLQEQKKQDKDQTTLSSLRLERLNNEDESDSESSTSKEPGNPIPKTYEELNSKFGLVIKDHDAKGKGKPLGDKYHPEEFPIRAINKVCFNPNFKSFTHIAAGYNCGLIRIQRLKELQCNNALKSFSEGAKKPRL